MKKYPKKADLQAELARLRRVNGGYAHWKRKWYKQKGEMIMEIRTLRSRNKWLTVKLEKLENER